jgi:DNA processing protein
MSAPLPPDVRDLLALTLVPGVGPRITTALLERFGTTDAILKATESQLLTVPRVGSELAARILEAAKSSEVDAEAERVAKAKVCLLVLGTPEYPVALASVEDAPHLLYCRGEVRLADANAVGIVGSRRCTPYGRRIAERIAGGLARAGVCVVSGMARGIDGVAHRAALAAGGRTIAVVANGLSRVYPPEHAELALEVADAGAILTESPMGMGPQAGLFPARNRIISGLSRAVVVIEAPEQSGALITASHAGEQGRIVLAVPGPADAETSGGCNALIRDGAILCRGVDDVLEELHGVSVMARAGEPAGASAAAAPATPAPVATGPPPGLDDGQMRLWEFLADGPRTMDEMAQQLAMPIPPLSAALMMLEMKKAVRRLPGNRYERV